MLVKEVAAIRLGKVGEARRTEQSKLMKPRVGREYIVPVLLKSCAILELLRGQLSGLRIEQIHQQPNFAKTTVYRIVRTLAVSGYVRQSASGHYIVTEAIGPRPVDVRRQSSYGEPAG
ncbi:MAG: hypothetical protein NVSMB3_10840 [Acidobacteriaceae bacterium]